MHIYYLQLLVVVFWLICSNRDLGASIKQALTWRFKQFFALNIQGILITPELLSIARSIFPVKKTLPLSAQIKYPLISKYYSLLVRNEKWMYSSLQANI
ncbi:MAG: hypothetical protein A2583_05205 [Bdellovibrionales bacterium RIFOXYD1_FULL_53_11]|nr:MAG: hypothetical protein A2583_05205 [Bdellovibrionales bacterium RIFOXYD1_FULL_53_11]